MTTNTATAKAITTTKEPKRPNFMVIDMETTPGSVKKKLRNDYTDEEIAARPRVRVYVNLNLTSSGDETFVFSVKDLATGKVKLHAYYVDLENCRFVVSERTRQTVVAKNTREVHAYVEGDLVSYSQTPCLVDTAIEASVSYNPFRGPKFYDVETNEDVEGEYDRVIANGRCVHIVEAFESIRTSRS